MSINNSAWLNNSAITSNILFGPAGSFNIFSPGTNCTFEGFFKFALASMPTSSDLMIVVVGWLGYAGFNVIQSNKNKPEDINENIN